MAARPQEMVSELLERQHLSLEWLVRSAGIERRIAESIARQRYTPSPEQRGRIARALGIQLADVRVDHTPDTDSFADPLDNDGPT